MRNLTVKLGAMAFAAALIAGCATSGGGGMSDEDAIRDIISQFETAMVALDFDAAFAMMSDDFEMSDGLSKDEYKEFLVQLKDADQFEGVEMSTESLTITIEGDTAEAMPFEVVGAFGAATLEFELEKRDGKWVVVYVNQIVG